MAFGLKKIAKFSCMNILPRIKETVNLRINSISEKVKFILDGNNSAASSLDINPNDLPLILSMKVK
jgi:hypothetical protein